MHIFYKNKKVIIAAATAVIIGLAGFSYYVFMHSDDNFIDDSFKIPERNYENIENQSIREIVDPKYNKLADELSVAYYDFWRKGKSKDFYGYDKQDTVKKSKELFDKLHGLIWLYYDVEFHNYNSSLPEKERLPEERYNIIHKADGVILKKKEQALEKIEKLENEGIDFPILKQSINEKNNLDN